MDSMIQLYYEESEELLQKAEECMIRLEMDYSGGDINELFRIAHTIKGSSHMVGYADIGNLMHKIEDMLDCARNGSIPFDQSIVTLCFAGLDITKKMLMGKKEQGSGQMIANLSKEARQITEQTEAFIRANKKIESITETKSSASGIITSYLGKCSNERNRYFISFFFEDDLSMISPVLLMILDCVKEIGTLVYSSVGDTYFEGNSEDQDLFSYDIILATDIEEAELYANLNVTYVEKINIVDLSRSKVAKNDYHLLSFDKQLYVVVLKAMIQLCKIGFSEKNSITGQEIERMESLHEQLIKAVTVKENHDKMAQFLVNFEVPYEMAVKRDDQQKNKGGQFCLDFEKAMIKLIEKGFNEIKGRYIISIFKAEKGNFISRLRLFMGKMNKTATYIFLIDMSQLAILSEIEVKALIEIKRNLEAKNIELGIIAKGSGRQNIINIFDSIEAVEKFQVSKSSTEAILKILRADVFSARINAKKD